MRTMKKTVLATLVAVSTFSLVAATVALACDCHGKGHKHGAAAGCPHQKAETTPATSSKETGTAECAICGMEMKKSEMIKFDYKGKDYYVCSAEEKAEFLKNPEKYTKKEK